MVKRYYETPRRDGVKPGRRPRLLDLMVLEALPATTMQVARTLMCSPSGAYYRLRVLETEGRVRRESRSRQGWTWTRM